MKIKTCIFLLAVVPVMAMAAEQNELGKTVYEKACSHCHAPDKAKAIKAPPAFDKKVWQARFKMAEKKSGPDTMFDDAYDYLVYQVKIGRGLMQHHGLCLESNLPKSYCTDAAYIAAIKYMMQ